MSTYVGLHIVDIASGRDIHLPALPNLRQLIPEEQTRLGCTFPTQVAWAPDGRRLAYACTTTNGGYGRASAIFTIRNDGTRHERVRTGIRHGAGWPAWSPDGKRIAFTGYLGSSGRPAIYTVRVDGSDRRRVALDGQAPSWSPDGKTIAYESSHGEAYVSSRRPALT